MVLRYHGKTSSHRSLPGSAPQGVFLGCFFFMVKFNGAFLRPDIPRPFPKSAPLILSKSNSCTVKYIDDASRARAINLKKNLTKIDLNNRPRPLEFHEHTGFILLPENNDLQRDLDDLKKFTDENLMTINQRKTSIMKFNFRKSLEFPAIFNFENGPTLSVVSESKILGIIISSDLRWSAHVEYMICRAKKKTWTLRRLKILNLDYSILRDFYCKEIRSILEFGVAVWNSGITSKMSEDIERVQKICIRLILSELSANFNYEVCCTILNLEPLIFRRHDLCVRFIQNASKDIQHADLLYRNNSKSYTRHNQICYREFMCRSSRFYKSPLCYLTRLLNDQSCSQTKRIY